MSAGSTRPVSPEPVGVGVTEIALVRHGETEWNRTGRIQGRTDIPLNETGRAQARAAAATLGGAWAASYSSSLGRAEETARIISDALGVGFAGTDQALVERAHGEVEGLRAPDRLARFPHGAPVPGYESDAEVVERALPALRRIASRHAGDRVVVVAHGGVIGALLRSLTGGAVPAPGQYAGNASVQTLHVHDDGAIRLVEAQLASRV
ncbi:histidine phosphatase family protein [Agromyces seonyuensis]|uniref:Histidine phosphatase family protein n=1 Tax=Agromyces seonyuensis TaxID=2662446 RepID=A0A6I4NW03_9MICO|nr:histidine phosphatase family protein [Agromyces seonyuensis]